MLVLRREVVGEDEARVDLDCYPTLTVTSQKRAGQESSGEVVLTGKIG